MQSPGHSGSLSTGCQTKLWVLNTQTYPRPSQDWGHQNRLPGTFRSTALSLGSPQTPAGPGKAEAVPNNSSRHLRGQAAHSAICKSKTKILRSQTTAPHQETCQACCGPLRASLQLPRPQHHQALHSKPACDKPVNLLVRLSLIGTRCSPSNKLGGKRQPWLENTNFLTIWYQKDQKPETKNSSQKVWIT